jgi:amino acid adenylation domain-containing protein/non-ribosomal peptide synthase protein (TIGR01720 family)
MNETVGTVSHLSAELDGLSAKQRRALELLLRRRGQDPSRLPIPRAPRGEEPLPLGPGQLSLWLADQAVPGSAAYVMPAVLRLTGPLDAAALAAAFTEVVARHEALRTTFPLHAGHPVQRISPEAHVDLVRCEPPEAADEAELARWSAGELAAPFDLARGPLLRARLARRSAREHILLLAVHHIVADRWSMTVFLREVAAFYAARCAGVEARLPEPAIQHADFALWQRRRLEEGADRPLLDYWLRQLEGVPQLLDLPADRPRPPVPSGQGGRCTAPLPARTADGVRELCRAEGVTAYMVLLAAFLAQLHRITDRERMIVGSPVAGRERAETHGTIGLFVNTLPLAADLSGDPSFRALLARVRETALGAFAHQELPFQRLVEALRPVRDPRFHPLYQVMFALQDIAVPLRELAPGLELELLDVHPGGAQVDLTLVAGEAADGLVASWEHSRDLFDETRIARLAGHFATLLAAAAAAPDLRLSELPLLGAGECWQLLGEWNPAPAPLSERRCVQDRFAERAALDPGAVALVGPGGEITYGELERSANRLARVLRELGAGPEVPVGLCLERSPEMVAGLLAILTAGGVYVPLDPQYPAERLALMIEDANLRVLVTQERLLAALPPAAAACRILCLDRDQGCLEARDGSPLEPWAAPENLAYLIYTSGSTGRPKGVGIHHGAAAHHLEGWRREHALGQEDRVYQFASLSFDASLEQILPSLYAGARLVLRGDDVPTPESFARQVDREGITVAYLPTAFWHQVARQWAGGVGEGRSLRLVNPGGDVMPPEAVHLYHSSPVGQVTLLNGYGPTEALITSAIYRVPAGFCEPEPPERIPIGRPYGERSLYVLDRRGVPVPLGVPGEMHIGGPLLARGYHRRPALVAERFVPDPFSVEPGGRLYRTGDLVRHLPDGRIEFLGRVDHQVKVRGFRIELGEIEAALRRLPQVREAVVLAPEDRPGYRRLVAYVAAAPGATAGELREALGRDLPGHMVPAGFVLLERLPVNANGKVDRQRLQALEPEPETAGEAAAPRTAVEAALVRLWTEVLGRPRVGIQDNFFSIGGDSIVSLQVITRAHQEGIRLTPSLFFRYPTVAELAVVAEVRAESRPVRRTASGPVALTPIQRWFFDQQLAEPHHWNQALLLATRHPLDGGLLERAVPSLLRHHDALRAHFVAEGGVPRMVIEETAAASPVIRIDLAALPPAARAAAFESLASGLQAGFDLARPPLLRMALVEEGTAARRLLLVAHHLIVDGVSWRILLEDLETAYRQLAAGCPVELIPTTSPLTDWSARLAELAGAGDLLEEIPFWQTQLAAGPAGLLADGPGGDDTFADAGEVEVRLGAEETASLLRAAPRAYRTQINDLLLTALVQACARLTGRPELVVELEGHGREEVGGGIDVVRTVGWFTTKYPVRLDLSSLADPAAPGEALKAVKEQLRAVPRRGLGYGLLRHLAPAVEVEALRASACPCITFNYLGQFDDALEGSWSLELILGGAGPECGARNRRPSPLEIVSMVVGGELRIFWRFGRRIFRQETVEAAARELIASLRALLAHCLEPEAGGLTPSDVPLARIDQAGLDRLWRQIPQLEDLYPLSPVQQGMLYHSLRDPASGVYVEQLVLRLVGDLDVAAFRDAWQRVIDARPVLRTAFLWERLHEPLQAVSRTLPAPLAVEDWLSLDTAEQEVELERRLREDRVRGFDLAAAPVMRLFLFRTGEAEHRFVWSNHHLLVDGWSEPKILEEVFAAYAALCDGRQPALAPRPSYRRYIEWLREQDRGPAESFWRRHLAGFTRPNRLPADPAAEGPEGNAEEELALAPAFLEKLREVSRGSGLTLNTLLQGAWALVLGQACGDRDVVLGVTVSGRPAELPGSDEMVGMFINTLPLRARLAPEARLLPWLRALQEHTAELLQHESSHLVEIQGWSEVPRGLPLFETIVVCMNQPRDLSWFSQGGRGGRRVEIAAAHGIEQTNYPFTVTALFDRGAVLQVNYRRDLFGRARVRRVLHALEALLAAFAERSDATLEELMRVPEEVDRRLRAEQAERLRGARAEVFRKVRRRAPESADPVAAEERSTP